jgi:hypothetical protein
VSTQFHQQQLGPSVQHVLNDGATTTSTETTAQGVINTYETTTTTDITQIGTGHGHIVKQFTTTSTTSTEHPVTYVKHNTHTSTTDIDSSTSTIAPAAAGQALCGGSPFSVVLQEHSADVPNKLCLHVKGGMQGDTFEVAAVKRPVIIFSCLSGSPNQLFTWLPTADGGNLRHDASGLLVSVSTDTVVDGSEVTVLPAVAGSLPQEWVWANASDGGGTISSMADEHFEITDSRVNQATSGGMPVHMWHLHTSLPKGMPNAAWYATCADN